MASVNKVLLLGNLGRDPELRSTPKGNPVLNFPMATTRRWKDRETDEIRDQTDWHRIVVWGRQAEVASEYLSKGSSVLIEGRLKLDTWETEGQKRSKLRVVGERMQMLSGRDGGGGGGRPKASGEFDESEYSSATASGGPSDDEVPF